jgi:hypothetical protein
MAGFKMNPNFGEEIGRQVNANLQKMFDAVFRRHAGQPVPDVKEALKRELKRGGADITDPELTNIATAISEGTRIKVRAA